MKINEILSLGERRLRFFFILLVVLLFICPTFLLPVQGLGNDMSVSLTPDIHFSPTFNRSSMSMSDPAEYKLLIIAPAEFIDELEPLKQFKDATDRPTLLISLDDVYNDFEGADEAEQVKKCIAHHEATNGIEYVLLVGDCDKLPVRYVYYKRYDSVENTVGAIADNNDTVEGIIYLPTDLYYADLYNHGTWTFCSWDSNGNGFYDENYKDFGVKDWYEPGPLNIDEVDLKPDVAVGRIPASFGYEVERYVNKLIDYEISGPNYSYSDWFDRALFISGIDNGMWGPTTEIEQLNEGADLLETLGFETIRLYDSDYGGDEPPTANNINERLNEGASFVTIHCHGNRWGWDNGYTSQNMTDLDNGGKLPILYSMACLTAAFAPLPRTDSYRGEDGTVWSSLDVWDWPVPTESFFEPQKPHPIQDGADVNTIGEMFLQNPDVGAIAVIGATDVALTGQTEDLNDGYFDGIHGASLPNPQDRLLDETLGKIWNHAIQFYIATQNVTEGSVRSKMYRFNLFGDPSLFVGGVPNQQWAVGDAYASTMHWTGTEWIVYDNDISYYPDLRSVSIVSPTDGWAVGTLGRIFRWNGRVWREYDSPTENNLWSVSMLGHNDGWAVGVDGTILRWDGTSWSNFESPTTVTLGCLDMVNPWEGWAAGHQTILHWNGTAWLNWGNPTGETLSPYSICMVSEDEGYMVGQDGIILEWNGDNWVSVTSPTTKDLRSVSVYKHPGSGGTVGGAVGNEGTILYCSGGSWSVVESPTSKNLYAIWEAPVWNNIGGWAVGAAGVILRGSGSFDWNQMTSPTVEPFYDICWQPRNYPPVAELDDTPFYAGTPTSPMTFNASASYDPDGDTLEYFWDFGDGVMGTGVNPSHTYDIGSYNLTLYVYDGQSWDAIKKPVIIMMQITAPGFSWEVFILAIPTVVVLMLYRRRRYTQKTC
ncbi:MAG: C25 family cysteine peptidase [Promethearchaeota archaeon]